MLIKILLIERKKIKSDLSTSDIFQVPKSKISQYARGADFWSNMFIIFHFPYMKPL